MNGNGRIGLDGTGMRASSGSERVKRTRSVEPSGSGMKVMSRSKGFGSAYERRSNGKKVTMLLVCAAVIIIFSGMALASLGNGAQKKVGTLATPVASFIVTSAANASTVTVDASASTGDGGITSYAWNWGDNITQTGVTASHTYYPPGGNFTITLTVTDTLDQKDTSSKVVRAINGVIPPPPFLLYGTTYASDGTTPLAGCTVTVTDVTTGATLIGIVSDGTGTYYVMDLNPLYQLAGDTIIVNAIGPAGEIGSGTGVIGSNPYLGIDVTLTDAAIPEFTAIVIPIAGMISIFAVARVASRRKEE